MPRYTSGMERADPSPTGTSADLSEVDLLLRLARRWRRLGAQETVGAAGEEHGLSPHQERALLAVARLTRGPAEQDHGGVDHVHDHRRGHDDHLQSHGAGVRVSRLAAHLGIAPRSATEVADALESAGLLARSPDPTDRRAVLLALTERGRHTVAAVRDRRRAAADQAVATLSPADRADLRRLLQTLLDA